MPNTAHHCHRDPQPLRATSTHTQRLVGLTWVLFWVKVRWMDHGEHYLRSLSQGKKTMSVAVAPRKKHKRGFIFNPVLHCWG
ncbi:hypothetical protein CMV_004163 [Castanea mollissima]|uniref:Uncharacterized protein n=1 Tax=Castanea mollissima TaxID=60419 RepID=A0A8J4RS93_9ROSI|nr:hypothetical protein CMV_004163 [Castanea mollissima]